MGQQGLVQTAVIYQRPHLPFVGREGRIRAGDALGLADQPSVVVTAPRGVSAEIGPRRGVSRRQQVVARQVRTDIVGGCRILGGPVVHRIFQQRLVIAELGFGGVGQCFRGIFRGFVPFLIIQEEPCGEGISRFPVEVVLGNRIDRVVDKRQSFLDILFDFGVHFGYRTAFVFRVEFGFGLLHVRDSHVVRIVGIVLLAENVHQHEVGVCPADQRFALGRAQLVGHFHFPESVQHLIGIRNGQILRTPRPDKRFVVGFHGRIPGKTLFVETTPIAVGSAVVIDIVRSQFQYEPRLVAGIGRDQHVDGLFLRIDRRAVVRVLVEEVIAGRKACGKSSGEQNICNVVFHIVFVFLITGRYAVSA